ncbi:conserved hypothetical protein [Trichinella spiralis]|uniref:hypothetical protein n=1 Tax=Trichinella spiralis TaxID=6334 RepID=UPI0001EFC342|nr:conserved hypothetical protein [Trichinella spiralis]
MGKLTSNRESQITCQQVKQNNSNVNVARAGNNCYTSVANNQFLKRTVILHAEFILLSNQLGLGRTIWRGLTKVAVTDKFRKQFPLNDLISTYAKQRELPTFLVVWFEKMMDSYTSSEEEKAS